MCEGLSNCPCTCSSCCRTTCVGSWVPTRCRACFVRRDVKRSLKSCATAGAVERSLVESVFRLSTALVRANAEFYPRAIGTGDRIRFCSLDNDKVKTLQTRCPTAPTFATKCNETGREQGLLAADEAARRSPW